MKDKADPVKVLQSVAIKQRLSKLSRNVQIYVHKYNAWKVIQAGEMADNYVQAQKPMASERTMPPWSLDFYTVKCQYCGRKGHLARDCRKAASNQSTDQTKKAGTDGRSEPDPTPKRRDRRCYRCNEPSRIASNSPNLYVCDDWMVKPKAQMYKVTRITQRGEVEGTPVDDISLTGSA